MKKTMFATLALAIASTLMAAPQAPKQPEKTATKDSKTADTKAADTKAPASAKAADAKDDAKKGGKGKKGKGKATDKAPATDKDKAPSK